MNDASYVYLVSIFATAFLNMAASATFKRFHQGILNQQYAQMNDQ
jgi:hypothetical protein